ncbi:MAG: MMPL family transporter [Gammaproteobacteria bacterium]|jgi:hypothetical protein|nr:MMPL family transporter [Gammaproteobacteria bacterium]
MAQSGPRSRHAAQQELSDAHASDLPVITDPSEFGLQSGSLLERMVFNYRWIVIGLCAVITVLLAFQATKIQLRPGFEKMLPENHPYVINFKDNYEHLRGLGNILRVVVSTPDGGSVYDPEFLATLEAVNEAIFFLPGVDRKGLKSVWTSNTRWRVVTEEGFDGGPVMPPDYNGSQASIEELKRNVARAGLVGDLIANNLQSAAILVPLLDTNPDTGEPLNYYEFATAIEEVRQQFEGVNVEVGAATGQQGVRIYITGFAKLIGDLIEGLFSVMVFFAIAVAIATALLYWYTRCMRSTLVVIGCTLVAVVWQLGLLTTFGYALDPFSILVPFLVFAIGVSHGAQKLNGVIQDIGRGTHPYVAARYTFRRLFLAGVTALLSDGVGFAVLMVIQIQVIQDLAITASIGVLVLILTNLILIPVLFSFIGVSAKAAKRATEAKEPTLENSHWLWRFLVLFTERKWALIGIGTSVVISIIGVAIASNLQIGDLDPGAPELRPESRYNQDMAFINANYSVSSDIFAVIVKTPENECTDYESLSLANELEWRVRQLPGVEDVRGLNVRTRSVMAGLNEGYPGWLSLFRNQDTINYAVTELTNLRYVNPECSVWPMLIYLADHKAATLQRVVDTLEAFNEEMPSARVEFMGAAGSAGFEAATNIVVKKANREMMFYVFGAVILLCLITFRSVRGVICAVLPLFLTALLCEALMVVLGIGIKVATLPVIALGVGIGVDYALYVLTVILQKQRQGIGLKQAYFETLNFTGRVVALIGVTLAAGVVTWVMSPIKFQADMGILLTFMFLWNMVGALVLMPSLAHFLLPDAKPEEGVATQAAQPAT